MRIAIGSEYVGVASRHWPCRALLDSPSIGGHSALSFFGFRSAALIGVDPEASPRGRPS